MSIENMTIEEVEAAIQKLRERKKALRQGGKAAERKIGTLARRRERLLSKVADIDALIMTLRNTAAPSLPVLPKRRGRKPAQGGERIGLIHR
ncbi:MAG: hypothetical protein BWY76_02128 [bacterium ADurb.Bin429]|nr:MAG: hypothetical protein BWY76_02128 [bacterium ADurb.Bin429]